MINQIHKTFSWVLLISLIWLPISVSADNSRLLSDYDMSGYSLSNHSMQAVMSDYVAADNAMYEGVQQRGCCDDCDCVNCAGMTTCSHSSNHISAFILDKQYSSQPAYLIQSLVYPLIHYHNQIITPDFRPPIV